MWRKRYNGSNNKRKENMDKELAKQLNEVQKIHQDAAEIRKIQDDITNIMNDLEV